MNGDAMNEDALGAAVVDVSLPQVVFLVLAAVAVISALLVILPRTSPVHSALYLVVTFFAIGAHYVVLNAQFLAAVHVLVYAGAIMVLFLFVIMLLNQRETLKLKRPLLGWLGAGVTGGLLLLGLVGPFFDEALVGTVGPVLATELAKPGAEIGLVSRIGQVLFSDFRAPFELVSLLFLAAIVGAVLLSRRDPSRRDRVRALKPTE